MNIKRIRDRTWHYLTPDVAASAGLSLDQLKQFCTGTFNPNQEQIEALTRRMELIR